MATTFKTLLPGDVIDTRNRLHESIPITGTIVSGTYGPRAQERNIKDYSHGLFQSVFDYPFLSSSANHIFDLTMGYSSNSPISSSGVAGYKQQKSKINIYNQMAQVLMGHDADGNIREFDADGDLTGGSKIRQCYFMNISRLLGKDEIKKGSFQIDLGLEPNYDKPFSASLSITDTNAETSYKTNSPAGEYGILKTNTLTGGPSTGQGGRAVVSASHNVGLIFYQAGVVVLSSSIFHGSAQGDQGILDEHHFPEMDMTHTASVAGFSEPGPLNSIFKLFASSSISGACNAFRHRLGNVSFNNTTELNSTIYFCRANANEFNYSSNPTYLKDSKIRVKADDSRAEPVSYITTVGLYGPNNELLAVGKLSEPLKKTPSNELTVRVRLDY
jgi:hypothetical protein